MSANTATGTNGESIAIIGAGLVGGAVLEGLVLDWAQGHIENKTAYSLAQPNVVRRWNITKLYITATSETKLSHQLQKTRDLCSRSDSITFAKEGPLGLTLHQAQACLQIVADPLDIVPSGLSSAYLDDETFRANSPLYTYLLARQPRILVIAANLASIVAYKIEERQNQTLAWILTTLKKAADVIGIETVAIVGTTALGGLGTNIVWTHQSAAALDIKLTGKILAAYGILGVLDRMCRDADFAARLVLLTPGSVLGYDYLDFGPVKYFSVPKSLPDTVAETLQRSGMSIPLYHPLEVDIRSLSERVIDWNERRIDTALLTGAKVKCGENGELSPLQFACITHALQMGFNSNTYIARILIDELAGKTTGYNHLPLGSGKVIEPSAQGQVDRQLILQRLAELEQENHARSAPVYPAVGSARVQKEIVLADLLFRMLRETHGEVTLQRICGYEPEGLANELWNYLQDHPRLLAEITAVIPVISPTGKIYTGPYSMYLGKGICSNSDLAELVDKDRFRRFAALGAVDLRSVDERIGHPPRAYETGVTVLLKRARFILENCVQACQPQLADNYGSAVDLRSRHWMMLTSGEQTAFDPVFFVVQFLGGERPY
jgi:hypothetical protein